MTAGVAFSIGGEMRIEAYAKVNLTLEVLGMRPDGYHDLRSVVAEVDVSDSVSVAQSNSMSCTMSGIESSFDIDLSSMGSMEDNLAVKAARFMQRLTGRANDVDISIGKRIPLGGGLGGGSADAAAVIVALERMWGTGMAPVELANMSASVGSDVPALVLAGMSGSMVVMEGRGERVSPLKCALPRPVWVVLANPGVFSSTPRVFKECGVSRDAGDKSILERMERAVASGDPAEIASALQNDLSDCAIRIYPEIARARDALMEEGALGSQVSGSGATVFAIARSEAEARSIEDGVRRRGLKAIAARLMTSDMVKELKGV